MGEGRGAITMLIILARLYIIILFLSYRTFNDIALSILSPLTHYHPQKYEVVHGGDSLTQALTHSFTISLWVSLSVLLIQMCFREQSGFFSVSFCGDACGWMAIINFYYPFCGWNFVFVVGNELSVLHHHHCTTILYCTRGLRTTLL